MEPLVSINPFSGEVIHAYKQDSVAEIEIKLKELNASQELWRCEELANRVKSILEVAERMRREKHALAELMTREMGKRLTEATAELDKCILLCEYYATHASTFLSIENDFENGAMGYSLPEPLGVILGVMPWNYPFWQVFRFAIPTLLSGNTVVLKHASNVSGCALAIETLFANQIPVLRTLILASDRVESIIANPIVKGVSLTGSEAAGRAVAALAGKFLKPSLLELGGNNAFIVLEDADLDKASSDFIIGRFQNAGQSCIAAKRLMVHAKIYDEFLEKLFPKLKALRVEDPADVSTTMGPMARADLAEELASQVQISLVMGAKLITGNHVNGACYSPTLIENVRPGMPAFNEELFGPVAAVIKVESFEEAISLSNQSRFGLGVSIYSKNIALIKAKISTFQEGAVFINSIVKSDPRLPFGGVKNSGYGRELAKNGILAFTNIKTVYIEK